MTISKDNQFSQDKQKYGKIYDVNNYGAAKIERYYTTDVVDTIAPGRLYDLIDGSTLFILTRQAPGFNQTIIPYHQYYILKFVFSSDFSKVITYQKLETPFNVTGRIQGLDKVGDTFYTTQSQYNETLHYETQYLIHFDMSEILSNTSIPVPEVNKLQFRWMTREFFQIDHNYLYTLERYYALVNNTDANIFSRVVKYNLDTMTMVNMANLTLQYDRDFKIHDNYLWLWYMMLPYQGIEYYDSGNQTIEAGYYGISLNDLFRLGPKVKPQKSVFIHDYGLANFQPYEQHNGKVLEQDKFASILTKGYLIYPFAYYVGASLSHEFNGFQVLKLEPRTIAYYISLFDLTLTISGFIILIYVLRKVVIKLRNKSEMNTIPQ